MFNPREVRTDRLSSLDQDGYRQYIHPEEVNGKYRQRRNAFYFFLIVLFLVVPWTTFKGEQTILLSLTERKFVVFGNIFWAHDAPIIFFILAIATMGLTLVTSVWGRVWCGWACPQTVFIDFLYRRVEGWVEGNFRQRRQLQTEPWTASKIFKKTIKWFLFFLISSHIAHSFVAYFVGAKSLFWITLNTPDKNWTLFIVVQFLTALFLLDFGWFREQFCVIMCPYGRFQSVLFDPNSMVVAYDHKRGEPRKGVTKGVQGDCVDCYKCVNVCPTGIDIRNGLQMECIACTACMDACDSVMEKINKPTGLIRYSTQNKIEQNLNPAKSYRPYAYLTVFIGLWVAFLWIVSNRQIADVKIIRAVETPYQKITTDQGNMIMNQFKVHIKNQSEGKEHVTLELVDSLTGGKIIAPTFPLDLSPEAHVMQPFFIQVPEHLFGQQHKAQISLKIKVTSEKGNFEKTEAVTLLGP